MRLEEKERKPEAVTQGGNMGIDHLTQRTQGAGIVKSWKDKRPWAYSRYIHIKIIRAPATSHPIPYIYIVII